MTLHPCFQPASPQLPIPTPLQKLALASRIGSRRVTNQKTVQRSCLEAVQAVPTTNNMAEQPPWRAIQPPKLPRFTGEADGCDADEFIQEAERILWNFRMEEGTAVEWLIQALEGPARREVLTHAAGEADTAAKVLAVLAETFGDHRGLSALLTSFHGRRQGMGESVVGYAQHLLMLTTKLNAAQADAINPAMLCDRFIDRLHPPIPPSRHSSLRQGAWRRHLPSGTGWGSALDARGCWCGGASRAGPGGSTPAQQGTGGAAGPSSGSDGEDSRAAGWAATPVNPGTTA